MFFDKQEDKMTIRELFNDVERNEKILKERIASLLGNFSWDFGQIFVIEIPKEGIFIWKDPDYGGDNSISLLLVDRFNFRQGLYRNKGLHIIKNFIGNDFTIGKIITKW